MNTLLYNDGEMYNASMYDFYATHTYNMFDDNTTSSLNTLDIYQYGKTRLPTRLRKSSSKTVYCVSRYCGI